ncbi:hypothetical protein VIGAN_08173100 [Vigna angularis var. angularis]|uniref:Uncharacterized protein n=1 Tax=Vigna angularis var. angularis TaxID=157739 RepID=A0A0S3SQG1_PHAAN|nr:hypothetical protein VIGAN_08173100 [Vigna angularis var. angularis]
MVARAPDIASTSSALVNQVFPLPSLDVWDAKQEGGGEAYYRVNDVVHLHHHRWFSCFNFSKRPYMTIMTMERDPCKYLASLLSYHISFSSIHLSILFLSICGEMKMHIYCQT